MTLQRPIKVGRYRVWICSSLDLFILIGISLVMGAVLAMAFG